MNYIQKTRTIQELVLSGWEFGINEGGKMYSHHQYKGTWIFSDEDDFNGWLVTFM